jgi:diguanylate cyclase (GGDEF)-like protein
MADGGHHVKRKICLALAVSSVIPFLILAWALHANVVPLLDASRHAAEIVRLQALLVFTGLLIVAGAFIVCDLAGVSPAKDRPAEPRMDEAELASARTTVEEQGVEISRLRRQLENARAELERSQARLLEASFTDEVTALYNRRFFTARLTEEVSRFGRFGHPASVVLFDLDGFKSVNDQFGHAAGDETLRAVAELLQRHSRGINVICRYGGDEFAVLLVETPKDGAERYAERIRRVLAAHAFTHGQQVTASFGVAALPDDLGPGGDLVRTADEALYQAKRAGKNRVSCLQAEPAVAAEA